MPTQMAMDTDSRQFGFVKELLTRLSRPTANELTGIERSVRAGFAQNFQRESGGGVPWASLRPRTVRERLAAGYPGTNPILVRSGVYRRSWTEVGGWRMFERNITGWVLHVSSDHRWAFSHERGVRSTNLPPRPVRYLDSTQERVVANAIDAWSDAVLRQVMT